MEWRVTSADGHPINGQFTFTVRDGDGSGSQPHSLAVRQHRVDAGFPDADGE